MTRDHCKPLLRFYVSVLVWIFSLTLPLIVIFFSWNSDRFATAVELPIYRELEWQKIGDSTGHFVNKEARSPQAILLFFYNRYLRPTPIELAKENDFNANKILVGHKDFPTDILRTVRREENFNTDNIQINSLQIPKRKHIAVLLLAEDPTQSTNKSRPTDLKTHSASIEEPTIFSSFELWVYAIILTLTAGAIASVIAINLHSLIVADITMYEKGSNLRLSAPIKTGKK